MDVYGDNGNMIAEEIPPELLSYLSYMEEVLPKKKARIRKLFWIQ